MIIKNKSVARKFVLPLILSATVALGACSSSDDDANMSDGDTDGMSTSGDTDADGGQDAGNSTDGETGGETDGDTGNDTDGGTNANVDSFAFTATASFPTGQIERISLAEGIVDATYPATMSDIRVESFGDSIYQLGRFQLDSLTKLSATDTSVVEYQYSLTTPDVSANPHDVVFVDETKAYVLRYGSPTIWIINPSATTEEEFKTGEIDISAYDPDPSDDDLSPNATSGVIVDDKLFVVMQRLTGFNPIETGYVAVFDVTTDTEIDTLQGDSLMGIPLNSLNPTDIRFNEATDEIFVTGRGNIFVEFNMLEADPYSGGLFAIDAETYAVSQRLDDGDQANNNGFIAETLVVSDTKGYVAMYANAAPDDGSPRTTLFTFDPSTGIMGEQVSSVVSQEVATLDVGSDGNVWMGVNSADAPGFVRINAEDDTLLEPFIPTSFAPLNIIFLDVEQ